MESKENIMMGLVKALTAAQRELRMVGIPRKSDNEPVWPKYPESHPIMIQIQAALDAGEDW